MVWRAGGIGLALALAGCTQQIVLQDVQDGGPEASDTIVPKDAGPGPDGLCGPLKNTSRLNYELQPDEIFILLDRSLSMQMYFGGSTREAVSQTALAYAVWQYQARIKFGFEEFPADTLEYPCSAGTCCAAPIASGSGPSLNNYTGMSYDLQCGDSHGSGCPATGTSSPSYAALAQVRQYYKTKDKQSSPANNRYVLLVTSTEPSCAAESHDICSLARSAASDLGDAGVKIVVLSVDYQPDPNSCLSQISLKGSTLQLPTNTKALYPVYNASELSDALTEFFSAVAKTSCTMVSREAPRTPDPAQLTVSVGNHLIQPIDGNSKDGWSFGDPNGTSITFSGSACDDWVNIYSQYQRPTVVYSDGPNGCYAPYP